MKNCKYCGKEFEGKSEYCSFNHYQLWRYHNDPKVKEKMIRDNKEYRKKRYSEDEEYRARQISYSIAWQKKNTYKTRLNAKRWYNKNKKLKIQGGKNEMPKM